MFPVKVFLRGLMPHVFCGLIASPSKTKLLFGDAAEKVDQDDARSRAVYLMDTRQRSEAEKALRATLEDRLHEDGHIDVRSTRFSLWMLAQFREEGVGKMALDRLDDLSASASLETSRTHGVRDPPVVRQAQGEGPWQKRERSSRSSRRAATCKAAV
jgi:hypothetical protein